ncbi:hypothetical protein CF70_030170 [Cupriavidus sp. SK-3]|nr:hypothetical protein CF70_030170 [Cupriavidus sp. SK-3]
MAVNSNQSTMAAWRELISCREFSFEQSIEISRIEFDRIDSILDEHQRRQFMRTQHQCLLNVGTTVAAACFLDVPGAVADCRRAVL